MSGTSASSRSSYVERKIDVSITLGEGTFGQSGRNTVKLSGLRVSATIQKLGPPSFNRAEVRIFGVQPSIMNRVSTLGIPLTMTRQNNIVTVEAGDDQTGMALVHKGYIYNAFQNFDGMPETFFQILSNGGAVDAMVPVAPISFPSPFDVATAMSRLAIQLGRTFEDNGVQVQLPASYFPGTAIDQIQAIARAANIEMHDDGPDQVLAIWPKNKTRSGVVPLISGPPKGDMIGYPRFRDYGMDFRCLYNPSIRLGRRIVMQTSLGDSSVRVPAQGATQAQVQAAGPNGEWYVCGLVYDLSARLPNGPWECQVACARTFIPTSR